MQLGQWNARLICMRPSLGWILRKFQTSLGFMKPCQTNNKRTNGTPSLDPADLDPTPICPWLEQFSCSSMDHALHEKINFSVPASWELRPLESLNLQ